MVNPLSQPRAITIFRVRSCWMAKVPEWDVWDVWAVPLPFGECVPACRVADHLRALFPTARIIVEEELR